MLITFSIANFRSFSSEETFSMVASHRLSEHPHHLCTIPNSTEKVVKTAVMYGANGAGKSNLFKAFVALKEIALSPGSRGRGVARQPFRFSSMVQEPSSFDVQFVAGQQMYRYLCKFNDQFILEEALLKLLNDGEEELFERITDAEGNVKVEVALTQSTKVHSLAGIGGPANQTFLATIAQMLGNDEMGDDLNAVLTWLESGIELMDPSSFFPGLSLDLEQEAGFREFASQFLHDAATGVADLVPENIELSEDVVEKRYGSNLLNKWKATLNKEGDFGIRQLPNGQQLYFERKGEVKWYLVKVQAMHSHLEGGASALDMVEESDGTRRLLDLLPVLHNLRSKEVTYVIDEIDRSLHPMLVHKFIEFFLKTCADAKRQIIVTTHESSLLDLDLLRRDEIWFAEKDQTGASHIYSLVDFKVRKDLEIRKGYLQGRFGAVPFLGNLDRLMHKDAAK